MTTLHMRRTAILISIVTTLAVTSAQAQMPPWAGQSFLPDYSKLSPATSSKYGQDYVYKTPGLQETAKNYNAVMIDQPEVFISKGSPYGGAKPSDLQGIAEYARSRWAAQVTGRGYTVPDQPGPGVVYIRTALTDLQLKSKGRSLLAYTPAGFVFSSFVRATQDFLQKMEVLSVAFQAEFEDSTTHNQLAETVFNRGQAGNAKTMSNKDFDAVIDDLGARLACYLDNGRVPEDQRIDCTDPDARSTRGKLDASQ